MTEAISSSSGSGSSAPKPLRIAAVLVAASTGGPDALHAFLAPLTASGAQAPILIVQHLSASFTPILANSLARSLNRCCAEAKDGELIRDGTIYLAPGGYHMRVAASGTKKRIALDRTPPINYCRPSADPLFLSAAEVFGKRLLAAILTGMGKDGLAGARAIVAAGGKVCAQDEASSIVWGMPGYVCKAGLATRTDSPMQLGVWGRRVLDGHIKH